MRKDLSSALFLLMLVAFCVAAVSTTSTVGPAGGGLTGTYPNPSIAPNITNISTIHGITNTGGLTLYGGAGTNAAILGLSGGPNLDAGFASIQAFGGDNVLIISQRAAALQGQSAIAFRDVNFIERAAMGYGNLRGNDTFNQLAYVEIGQLFTETAATPTDFGLVNTHQSDSSQYVSMRLASDSGAFTFKNRAAVNTLTSDEFGWTFPLMARIGSPAVTFASTGLSLANNRFIESVNIAGDSARPIFGLDNANILQIGSATAGVVGQLNLSSGNATPFLSSTSGNAVTMNVVTGLIKIGNPGVTFAATGLSLANNKFIETVNAANDTARPVFGLSAGNSLDIGSGSSSVVAALTLTSGNATPFITSTSGNVVTVSGSLHSTSIITSSTYTPTLTIVANLDATPTSFTAQYSRVGNVVTVSGKVLVNPTTTLTLTQLGLSLPIASALTQQEQASGTAAASGIASQSAAIRGDVTNDRAEMAWIATDVTDQPMYFQFQYLIQ